MYITRYLDGPQGVTHDPASDVAFVTGSFHGVTAIDVSDPANLVYLDSIIGSTTYMNTGRGISFDPSNKYLFVSAASSNSLAVVSVKSDAEE